MADIEKQATVPPGPECVDADTARLVFQSGKDYGLQLQASFRENLVLLGPIYDTLHRKTTASFESGRFEFPEEDDLYSAYKGFRRDLGLRSALPGADEFRLRLLSLCAQPVPFACVTRELARHPGGRVRIVTRFAVPLRRFPDLLSKATESAVSHSATLVRAALEEPLLFCQWQSIVGRAGEGTGLEQLGTGYERPDQMLRELYFLGATDAQQREVYSPVNQALKASVIGPLLKRLRRENLIFAISLADLRERQMPGIASDLLYFNNSERARVRLLGLSRVLLSPALQHITGALARAEDFDARNEQAVLAEARRLAEQLVDRLADDRFSNAERELIIEVSRLSTWREVDEKRAVVEAEVGELAELAARAKAAGTLVNVHKNGSLQMSEEHFRTILSQRVPGLLAVSMPPLTAQDSDLPLSLLDEAYVIYRERSYIGKAIEAAVTLFEKNGDTHLLFILEQLLGIPETPEPELKAYVAPVDLLRLNEVLEQAYRRDLPWWRRFWLMLSSGNLGERSLAQLRRQRREKLNERLAQIRRKHQQSRQTEAREQTASRARQNLEEKDRVREQKSRPGGRWEGALTSFLDGAWATRAFPNRSDVIFSGIFSDQRDATDALGEIERGGYPRWVAIRVPGQESVFASKDYLSKNAAELSVYVERAIKEQKGLLSGDVSNHVRSTVERKLNMLAAIAAQLRTR